MKGPICSVCINSDILCAGCEDKLKNGVISQGDVDLARALTKLVEKHPSLAHSEFKKTISHKDMFLVLVPKGMAGNFIGKRGIFIKELSEILGKLRIKIIEETSNPKELVQKILYPAQLLGVNVVYAGNREIFKVRVPLSDRAKIFNKDILEAMFAKLLEKEANIVFE